MRNSIKVISTGWKKGNKAAIERFTLDAAKKASAYFHRRGHGQKKLSADRLGWQFSLRRVK